MSSDDELEAELRRRYEDRMGGVPKWAVVADEADAPQEKGSSDEDEQLDSASPAIDPHKLQYRSVQCQDAYHTKRITSVMFNPCARMLLSTSKDRKLKLWEVGNRVVSHLHTEEMPANTLPKKAVFLTPSRDKVLIVNETRDSSRESIYFDMNTMQCRTQDLLSFSRLHAKDRIRSICSSNDGLYIALISTFNTIYLLNSQSLEVIRKYSLSSRKASSAAFSTDSRHLFASDFESNVYAFGLDSNRCVTKFSDDSGFSGQSTLALSRCSNYMAIGSHTGIVNIYRQHAASPDTFDFRLAKTFNNLVCQISFAHFNHSSELFAFGSGVDIDALKIAHCPSMTVYKNIPRQRRGSVTDDKNRVYKCADFSPNSGFFVAGQNSGQITTLRLAHYGSY